MFILILKIFIIILALIFIGIIFLLSLKLDCKLNFSTSTKVLELSILYFFSGVLIKKGNGKTSSLYWLGPFKWERESSNNANDELDLQFFAESKYFLLFNKYRESINCILKLAVSLLKKLFWALSDWNMKIHLRYSFKDFELGGKIYAFFSAFRAIFKKITVIPEMFYTPDNTIDINVNSKLSIRPILFLYVFFSLFFEKNTLILIKNSFKIWLKNKMRSQSQNHQKIS